MYATHYQNEWRDFYRSGKKKKYCGKFIKMLETPLIIAD